MAITQIFFLLLIPSKNEPEPETIPEFFLYQESIHKNSFEVSNFIILIVCPESGSGH
jgi:hypothetical protein